MANFFSDSAVTKTTLSAATVGLIGTLPTGQQARLLEIWDEAAAGLWYSFARSAPANTDSMTYIPAGTPGVSYDVLAMPQTMNVYGYSTAGGVVKVRIGK